MKKRWIWLAVLALTLVVPVVWMQVPDAPTTVSAMTLEPQRVEQTVSCMGMVESARPTVIAAPVDCVIGRVLVSAGDRVAAGDVLAVVDKEATRQALRDNASLMALAAMEEEIVAPAAGTVLEMKATEGQVLDLGSPCAVMALDEHMQIRIAIRERDLRTLKQGMAVRITGDGFDRSAYDGVLTSIASKAAADATGGIVVEGIVTLAEDAFDPSLRLGLTAKAVIVTSVTENGLLLPYEAVVTDDSGSYVYVVDGDAAKRQDILVAAQVSEGVLLHDSDLAQAQIIRDATCITASGQRIVMRRDEK